MSPSQQLVGLLEEIERDGTTVMELVCGGQRPTPWTHEAGHFHTVRLFSDHTAHLVAISMTTDGWPQPLFTLNLWAIGDAYEGAGNLRRYVRRFHLGEQVGPPPLVRFVNLIFQAFGPQIERLQEEKIATLANYRAAHPDRDIFEDRSPEVLSRVEVDVRADAGDVASTIPCCSTGEKPA